MIIFYFSGYKKFNQKITELEREVIKINYLLKVAYKKNDLSSITDDSQERIVDII